MDKVIVMHQYGAKSHYLGLKHYCVTNNKTLVWIELDLFRQFLLVILRRKSFKVLLKNFIGITKVLTGSFRNDDVVFAIAPYSAYIFLLPNIKANRVFYHTSWPFWQGDFSPYRVKLYRKYWDRYMEANLDGAFCVTEVCKLSFTNRYPKLRNNTHVVHHAIENFWFDKLDHYSFDCKYDFVYVGRMVSEKGVDRVIALATYFPNKKFVLVGDGPDLEKLKKTAPKNVIFLGRLGREELKQVYNSSITMLLPSLTSHNWVEAFGIVFLEASTCGCNIIATDHPGPLELSKFLPNLKVVKEKFYVENAVNIINAGFSEKKYSNSVLHFTIDSISKKWGKGLSLDD